MVEPGLVRCGSSIAAVMVLADAIWLEVWISNRNSTRLCVPRPGASAPINRQSCLILGYPSTALAPAISNPDLIMSNAEIPETKLPAEPATESAESFGDLLSE